MAYYSKNTNRMDIHIEEYRGTILIQQKWCYSWWNLLGTSSWTNLEKQAFHKKVDDLIWNNWGKYFFLKVRGTSDFAKRHAQTKWDVNFDIKWVLDSQHWKVNVTKYPNGFVGNPTSSIRWNARVIKLDTKDTSLRKRVKRSRNYYQYPVVHEFGHAAGNSIFASTGMHGDEYKSTSAHFNDKYSLMNIGQELRDRHLGYILSQLNTMLPNTIFSIL